MKQQKVDRRIGEKSISGIQQLPIVRGVHLHIEQPRPTRSLAHLQKDAAHPAANMRNGVSRFAATEASGERLPGSAS